MFSGGQGGQELRADVVNQTWYSILSAKERLIVQAANVAKDGKTVRAWKISGALSLLMVLSGCTAHKNDNPAAGSTASGSILRYPMTAEPTTFDPALVEDGTTIDLLQQVFEGLVIWGEDNQIHGNLAEKWDISADGKTYTFHLKPGAKFHNGREVTADDFKYSWERACDPATLSTVAKTYLKDIVGVAEVVAKKTKTIAGVKAIDKSTLQVTLDGFKPYWLGNMTYPCAYVVCREEVEKNAGKISDTAPASLTGTGPFKFASIQRGSQVSLTAFDGYHEGRPKLDGIVRPIVKDASQRINKYAVGDVDIVDVSPNDLDRINSDPKLKPDLKSFPRASIWYVALNSAAAGSPFGNLKVRQAFAAAADKSQIIQVAMHGQADSADGIVPPGVPGRNEHIHAIAYDPVKAKALLAEAGFPNGKDFPTLTISFRNDYPQVQKASEMLAAQWKANLNIEVQPRGVEWGQYLKERDKRTQAIGHLRWGADYLDPQNFLSTLLRTGAEENKVGYNNPAFDKLCDAADVEQDQAKRFAMYQQAEQMAVDEAPFVPLYFQRDLELVSPRVGNLHDSLFGHRPHVLTTLSR